MAAEATKLGAAHFLFDYSEIVTQACGGKGRDLEENALTHGGVKKKKQSRVWKHERDEKEKRR